jgi:hypothetical protein
MFALVGGVCRIDLECRIRGGLPSEGDGFGGKISRVLMKHTLYD